MNGKNTRTFKKGTCACESSSRINSTVLRSRKVNQAVAQAKKPSKMVNQSIKSRFF